jgi:hypothetical protein
VTPPDEPVEVESPPLPAGAPPDARTPASLARVTSHFTHEMLQEASSPAFTPVVPPYCPLAFVFPAFEDARHIPAEMHCFWISAQFEAVSFEEQLVTPASVSSTARWTSDFVRRAVLERRALFMALLEMLVCIFLPRYMFASAARA